MDMLILFSYCDKIQGNELISECKVLNELNHRVQANACCNAALIAASANGYMDVVKELLKDPRVDPFALDGTAVRLAAENGNNEVAELLKQHKNLYSKRRCCIV